MVSFQAIDGWDQRSEATGLDAGHPFFLEVPLVVFRAWTEDSLINRGQFLLFQLLLVFIAPNSDPIFLLNIQPF
jgi:hypothetical protein